MVDSIVCVSSKPKEEVEETPLVDEANDELVSVANVCDPEKYQEVFQARHRLSELTAMFGKLVCYVPSLQYCSIMYHTL